jgi:hypothetical protein
MLCMENPKTEIYTLSVKYIRLHATNLFQSEFPKT